MSKKGKWLKADSADQPLSEVVCDAVQERLKVVLANLRRVAKRAEDDIEHVHQLRVSTRRAQSALRLFSDVLPARRRSWWNRRLKRLRNAAGRARDLDVLIERLDPQAMDVKEGSLESIRVDLQRQRRREQKPLRKLWRESKREDLNREIRRLGHRVRWRGAGPDPPFHVAARQSLAPLVEGFFTAGAADLSDPENMHLMRLAGKKLRYAIELLSGAFDARLRQKLYPKFAQIQGDLGEINDHLVARTIFNDWLVQSGDRKIDERADVVGDAGRFGSEGYNDPIPSTLDARIGGGDARPVRSIARFSRVRPSQKKRRREQTSARSRASLSHSMSFASRSDAPHQEIERKFLVEATGVPGNLDRYDHKRIQQGYLVVGSDDAEVRVRRKGDRRFLTVKSGGGLQRTEYEIELSAAQFGQLWPATDGRRLEKVRHEIPFGDYMIELDVFAGALSGLRIAEVEFPSVPASEAFAPPTWFGREVTRDARFKNRNLAFLGRPTD